MEFLAKTTQDQIAGLDAAFVRLSEIKKKKGFDRDKRSSRGLSQQIYAFLIIFIYLINK